MKITVNNMPAYAYDCECIVARLVDGEPWFWGAFNEIDAERVAAEIDGVAFDSRIVA